MPDFRLPPDDSDEYPPTIDVSQSLTVEVNVGDRETVKLPDRNTHSYLQDDVGSRITLGTLVRARQGGADAAREQSKRKHAPLLKRAWRTGLWTGIATTVGVLSLGFGSRWVTIKCGALVWAHVQAAATWAWRHVPWRR